MLSAADLAAMRITQEATMTESCVRRRPVYVTDAFGRQVPASSDVATYPCRLGAPSTRELEAAGRLAELPGVMVTLPFHADVRHDDRLEVGGRVLRVVGILRYGAWQTAIRALAAEVTP